MTTVTVTWRGPALLAAKNGGVQDTLGKLASDIDAHLGSTLHVWTGEMRERRFADIDNRGDNSEVVFGSDAPHTVYHELFANNYTPHPQIRATGDLFGKQVGPRMVAAMQARLR